MEEAGKIKEAVHFFQRAGRFNHAVRLAKENDMVSELTMLAMQALLTLRLVYLSTTLPVH